MSRVRTAILRGGLGDEYDVSLKTGASVLAAIDKERFDPIDVLITKSGEWLVGGVARYPEHIIPTFDLIFIALHGTFGEDGTLQRLLERYGVSYTGSGPYASNIAMHKGYTKEHLKDHNIRLPKHVIARKMGISDIAKFASQTRSLFGPQYVVKPVASGSSVGVSLVENQMLLEQKLAEALAEHDEVLVEERIHGIEATCGVIERFRGQSLYALPPIEIIPPEERGFFAYDVKYNGQTRELCPATFSHEIKREIEHIAKQVHAVLGLAQYSRSDFMIAKDGVYFLEVNTLPGLTQESLFPKALSAVGSPYTQFLTHILEDALSGKTQRHTADMMYG